MNYTKEQISEIYTGWFKKLQSGNRDYNEFLTILIRASKFYFDIDEEWGNINTYVGIYYVSNFGRVKSLKFGKERILIPTIDSSGYHMVGLCINGINKNRNIHQLVTIVFLNHIPNGCTMVVNHKDFIKINNFCYNLEIITMRENSNQKHLKSSSNYVGVCWDKETNKWRARIKINGNQKHLGRFNDEYDAHLAYQSELLALGIKK